MIEQRKFEGYPYDMTAWGQEKVESLIKDVIFSLNLLDENESRTDEFKDSDLKHNIRKKFEGMAYNLTKLYAFFVDGQWETVDREYIVKERENGLDKIKKLYGIKDKN